MRLLPRRPLGRVCAAALAGVTGVHLAALAVGAEPVAAATKTLLMPALAGVVVAETAGRPRSRLVRATLVALALSWLGDNAPRVAGDDGFIVMVGFFLLAQIAYVVGFWPHRRRSALSVDRWRAGAYAVAVAGLIAACAPGAGDLLRPTVGYGVCLGTMAVLATGVAPPAALGGLLFFASDSLIALENFTSTTDRWPEGVASVAVMATYVAGQALLSAGILAQDAERAAPAPRQG